MYLASFTSSLKIIGLNIIKKANMNKVGNILIFKTVFPLVRDDLLSADLNLDQNSHCPLCHVCWFTENPVHLFFLNLFFVLFCFILLCFCLFVCLSYHSVLGRDKDSYEKCWVSWLISIFYSNIMFLLIYSMFKPPFFLFYRA